MLSRSLTVVLLLGLFGCGNKEFKKSSNSSVATVQKLNAGNPEEVIREYSTRAELSDRERYFLASAQSQAGGVDVLSLYSILEIQLFHKKALEWNDLSKEKNPYLKFMKTQENVDYEKRKKKREERWEKYKDRIIEKQSLLVEKPSYSQLKDRHGNKGYGSTYEITEEKYFSFDQELQNRTKDFGKKCYADLQTLVDEFYALFHGDDVDPYWKRADYYDGAFEVFEFYLDSAILENTKRKYLSPEECVGGDFSAVRWEMVYMNLLWNTYEAIPMIRKMPALSEAQQELVTDSLENYYLLIDSDAFKETSLKNLGVLTGVSLLSYYKDSFDLEEVNDMTDLFCSFDPAHLIKNYSMIRRRLLYLLKVHEKAKAEFNLGTLKKQIEQANEFLPEELSEAKKQEYIDRVDEFKVDFCFMR